MKSAQLVRKSIQVSLVLVGFLSGQWTWARSAGVTCLDHGQPIPVNNAQVLKWKVSTPNQFLARAHVSGVVDKAFADRPKHAHFQIKIGNGPKDTLEVVYNTEFGELPDIDLGMQVEACGDYITSIAQAGPYPPSPSGAIIHWVHTNPSGHGHDSGFLIIDGVTYGQDIPLSQRGRYGNGHSNAYPQQP